MKKMLVSVFVCTALITGCSGTTNPETTNSDSSLSKIEKKTPTPASKVKESESKETSGNTSTKTKKDSAKEKDKESKKTKTSKSTNSKSKKPSSKSTTNKAKKSTNTTNAFKPVNFDNKVSGTVKDSKNLKCGLWKVDGAKNTYLKSGKCAEDVKKYEDINPINSVNIDGKSCRIINVQVAPPEMFNEMKKMPSSPLTTVFFAEPEKSLGLPPGFYNSYTFACTPIPPEIKK